MKTLCIIPARGGSKGLARKNIKTLYGKPLIFWPILAARLSGEIDEVFVTTDDEEIAEVAISSGADVPFLRSPDLSLDLTTTEDTLKDALLKYEDYKGTTYDLCVFLTCTDVFRKVEWIRKAVGYMKGDLELESAFVANPTHKNYWNLVDGEYERVLEWMKVYSSRQIREKIYREDTGLACASRAWLWREGRRIGDKVRIIEADDTLESLIDIHCEFDLHMANSAIEYLVANNPERVELFIQGSKEGSWKK